MLSFHLGFWAAGMTPLYVEWINVYEKTINHRIDLDHLF
jgi:hypothetical protein